jgi:hypothetical protein
MATMDKGKNKKRSPKIRLAMARPLVFSGVTGPETGLGAMGSSPPTLY